jgi:hypothetical protein
MILFGEAQEVYGDYVEKWGMEYIYGDYVAKWGTEYIHLVVL